VELEEVHRAVLAAIGSIAPDTDVQGLRPDAPLREQVELDSLDWLNVITELHERFRVEIPESDYERLATLESMVAYLAGRQAQHPAAPLRAPRQAPAALSGTSHRIRGIPVAVRPIRPEDMPLEADFVRRLSRESRYQRFMLTLHELSPAKLNYLTDVDQVRHVALVATVDRGGRQALAGVARYVVDPAGTGCEFAIAVDDDWHGSGLAGILMHSLIDIARFRGLATMEGIVIATNLGMLRFVRQLGFRLQRDPGDRDTIRVVRAL
jgi:acyl carrier protein